jgi:hypothetical protein
MTCSATSPRESFGVSRMISSIREKARIIPSLSKTMLCPREMLSIDHSRLYLRHATLSAAASVSWVPLRQSAENGARALSVYLTLTSFPSSYRSIVRAWA